MYLSVRPAFGETHEILTFTNGFGPSRYTWQQSVCALRSYHFKSYNRFRLLNEKRETTFYP